MIHIHATKKLYAKLPINADGVLVSTLKAYQPQPALTSDNPLSGWHANLILLQKRNCILLVHDNTRFPVFMKSFLKADFANFDWHFADVFMNTLLKIDANQQQLDKAAKLLEQCQFDTMCNRSVQGTMNQMAGDIEHMLWHDNANIDDISHYRTGAWLAQKPCNVKGQKEYIWPQKAMLELLSE